MYRAADNSTIETLSSQTSIFARIYTLLCIVLLASGVPQSACAQSTADEYQVKAAFLYHFAQLIDWPAGVLNAEDPSLKLCVFDDEPRRQELQHTIEGKTIGALVLHVRLVSQSQEVQGCNILFLSRDEARRQTVILRSLRGMPVLTVGETSNFLSDGGMIRFHVDEDKIRFDINLEAAESSHLKISSRLLLLATAVTRGRGMSGGM
jgi:YfiR/HmsC-like